MYDRNIGNYPCNEFVWLLPSRSGRHGHLSVAFIHLLKKGYVIFLIDVEWISGFIGTWSLFPTASRIKSNRQLSLRYTCVARKWFWYRVPNIVFELVTALFPAGFEFLTAVVVKSTIFWDITPCSPLSVNRRFGGTYRLHLQVRKNKFNKKSAWKQVESRSKLVYCGTYFFEPEDGGDMFLRKVGWYSTDYVALYHRRSYSLVLFPIREGPNSNLSPEIGYSGRGFFVVIFVSPFMETPT
jgi:hypothetical protein